MVTRKAQTRLLDGKVQNRLARRLRLLDENSTVRTIRRLVRIEPQAGLLVANRVIQKNSVLESLLSDGVEYSNESTCRLWLEILGRRLGIDRTIAVIGNLSDPDRKISAKLLYWLPSVFNDDPMAKDKIEILRRRSEPLAPDISGVHSFLEAGKGWRWGRAA